MAAITQPRFHKGVEVALHHGELCFNTPGSNPKWAVGQAQATKPARKG